MPPKRRISKSTTPHLRLYEYLIAPTSHADALLKSMERQLQDEPDLFIQSIMVAMMRLVGMGEEIASVDMNQINKSVKEVIDEMYERYDAGGIQHLTTMLTLNKNPGYSEFSSRLEWLLDTLLSTDFTFASHIIKPSVQLLIILSRSKAKTNPSERSCLYIFLISSLSTRFLTLISCKQSKQAYSLLPSIESLISEVLKERIMDIDHNIKDEAVKCLKIVVTKLQDQVVNEQMLKMMFLKPISQGSIQRLETALSVMLYFLKIKKIEKIVADFCLLINRTLEEIAVSTSKCSSLALKILIELESTQKQARSRFSPSFLTALFQAHSSPPTFSLPMLISIFYLAHNCTNESLPANRSTLVLELTYLLRENDPKSINIVLDEFMQFWSIDPCQIFKIQELFILIMAQFYHLQGNDVYLKKEQMQVLLRMLDRLTLHIQFNLNKLHKVSLTSELTVKQKQKQDRYLTLANTYNLHLFTSIKQILFTKIPNSSASLLPLYFNLIAHVFIPVQPEFQVYLEYVLDKLKPMFEGEDNIEVAEMMVKAWIALGGQTKSLMETIKIQNKQILEDDDIAKITALIEYSPFPTSHSLLNLLLRSYKRWSLPSKLSCFLCLKHLHRWEFRSFMHYPTLELHQNYIEMRDKIIEFVLDLIRGEDEEAVKLAAFGLLCAIFEIAANNQISQMQSLVYEPKQDHMATIFRFLQHSLTSTDSLSISFSSLSISLPSFNQQLLNLTFDLFSKCYTIAFHQHATEFIGEVLRREIGDSEMDATMNQSLSETRIMGGTNLYLRQKYASKFIQKLVANEIRSQNPSKLIFWKFIAALLNQRKYDVDPLIARVVSLYYRKRSKMSVMSKRLLLFLAEQVDRGIEKSDLNRLKTVQLILKRAHRRLGKEAMYKFAMFCKEKAAGAGEEVEKFVTNINKMAKQPSKIKEQDQIEDDNGEQQLQKQDAQDERMDRRQTRSKAR